MPAISDNAVAKIMYDPLSERIPTASAALSLFAQNFIQIVSFSLLMFLIFFSPWNQIKSIKNFCPQQVTKTEIDVMLCSFPPPAIRYNVYTPLPYPCVIWLSEKSIFIWLLLISHTLAWMLTAPE